MKILIVADVYPPEVSSAAHLMQELAEGLVKRGHQVSVITSYPRHYLTSEAQTKSFEIFSEQNGVSVIRVKVLPHHKVNFIFRGFAQLILPFLFYRGAKKFVKGKLDAVIVYSPPLPLALVGAKIKHCYGAKFLLNIQDIFPQNAIDLGIFREKLKFRFLEWLAIKIFEFVENIAYQQADVITFHSPGGRRFLIEEKGVPSEKIVTLPNWIDLTSFQNLNRDISFRKLYGLENKFIFLFAGIFGPAQGLDFLAETAKRTADLKDVVFLLVGDGMEKEKLTQKIKAEGINNILIKPFISKDDYPYLVKDADAGVVCLSRANKTPFVPGKFLGYMAARKPVLAFLNKESDGFALMKEANCGYGAVSGGLEEAVGAVRRIYAEKESLKKMGENGFQYALNNFSLDICLKKIEDMLR